MFVNKWYTDPWCLLINVINLIKNVNARMKKYEISDAKVNCALLNYVNNNICYWFKYSSWSGRAGKIYSRGSDISLVSKQILLK